MSVMRIYKKQETNAKDVADDDQILCETVLRRKNETAEKNDWSICY